MRKRLLLLCAGTFFLAGQIRAQWVVTDPGNLAHIQHIPAKGHHFIVKALQNGMEIREIHG